MKLSGINRHNSFTHALALARYNLPLYLSSAFGISAGLTVACISYFPFAVRIFGLIVAIIALWYSAVSFFAFHWMFDRSNLLTGDWLISLMSSNPRRWVQLSIMLEETTLSLNQIFPDAEGRSLDLFDARTTTEPAITRARKLSARSITTAVTADTIPIVDNWADLTLVMLAAHEIRDSGVREKLFGELQRITSSSGMIVLVEHPRNLAAFAAFGPLGFFHFYPRTEWLRLAKLVNLKLARELSITPFVRVFAFTSPDKT